MSWIFFGKSKCHLCEQILEKDQDLIGFNAFLTKDHPLWRMSDAVVHRSCFDSWPHAEEFRTLYEKFLESLK